MTPGVVVAEFRSAWEARIARDSLADAGIEAWLAGPEGGALGESGRTRLLVAAEAAEEARDVLATTEPGVDDELPRRRPLWVPAVAALVLVGLVWASVPGFLWPWLLLAALVGFLLWRAAGPRTPGH